MNTGNYNDTARDFLKMARVRLGNPDLAGLEALMRAFGRFPYENLTKIIRAHEFSDAKRRMPNVVLSDHIDFGTGGTCFSLTYFFKQVLEFAGFNVYSVLCDRSYGPDTHCALIANLKEGNFLVDPGYLMDRPLRIPEVGHQTQRLRSCSTWLERLGESSQLLLFTQREGRSKLRYRLKDAPVEPGTFKRRWGDSFDWAMMRHICISRLTDKGQLFMRDGMLRLQTQDAKSQELILNKFSSAVYKTFNINPKIANAAMDCLKKGQNSFQNLICFGGNLSL